MTEETKVNDAETISEPQTAQPVENKQAADLNVSDLIAIKNIIDIASSRGAFKAAEFESVGKIFNKLNSFLEAVANNQKES